MYSMMSGKSYVPDSLIGSTEIASKFIKKDLAKKAIYDDVVRSLKRGDEHEALKHFLRILAR